MVCLVKSDSFHAVVQGVVLLSTSFFLQTESLLIVQNQPNAFVFSMLFMYVRNPDQDCHLLNRLHDDDNLTEMLNYKIYQSVHDNNFWKCISADILLTEQIIVRLYLILSTFEPHKIVLKINFLLIVFPICVSLLGRCSIMPSTHNIKLK